MSRILALFFVCLIAFPLAGMAQKAEKNEKTEKAEKTADTAPSKRVELARKMNEIRPAKDQVNEAIERAILMVPEESRAAMREKMQKSIDYQKLEQSSIDAMAEIFTEAELEKMITWFGSPEAVAVAKKIPLYQQKIAPEIAKSLQDVVMPPPATTAKMADQPPESEQRAPAEEIIKEDQ